MDPLKHRDNYLKAWVLESSSMRSSHSGNHSSVFLMLCSLSRNLCWGTEFQSNDIELPTWRKLS